MTVPRPMSRTESAGDTRGALVARWQTLTREILPAMAADHHWPIRLDHCFMRVCLDEAFGSPWTARIERPAVRTMSDAELRRSIAVAERIVAAPELLAILNEKSLAGRRARHHAVDRPRVLQADLPL